MQSLPNLAVEGPEASGHAPLATGEPIGAELLAGASQTEAPGAIGQIPVSPPRVRDGLLEEEPSAVVSVLVRLRGEPVSSVLLELRGQYGTQDSWSPAVRETASAAIDLRMEDLSRERDGILARLQAGGLPASATRDYRYLVNGLNLRNIPAAAVPLLAADPNVLHIERDHEVHIDLVDSVPLINADDVWNLTDSSGRNITGVGSLIANIDTGVDYTHPDLGGTLNRTNDLANFTAGTHTKFVGGWDFVNNDNDPWDDHYHGTHVAGIIGANGTLKGVAPGSKQLALKVLSSGGSGSDSDIIAAMEFATDPDRDPLTDDAADASSMSLGSWYPYPDGLEPLAADASAQLGTLCIIAAGNSGPDRSTVGSPGISRKSITVGSSTKADAMSSFSSRGPTLYFDLKPDLVAPGSSIISTNNGGAGGNRTLSGTSMATPHVSGVVALLRQAHPGWGVDELKSAMVDTAKDLGSGVFEQGGGRVDAAAAGNASVFALPHKLAMGRLSRSAAQTNVTLTYENLGAASVTLNLTARDVFGMYPNMTDVSNNTDLNFVTVVPTSLTLAPGERKTATVVFAPSGSATSGHYWGSVNASFPGSTVAVPLAYYVRAPIALVDDDSSDRSRTTAPFDNFAAYPDSSHNLSLALGRLNLTHDIFTSAHYDEDGPELVELLNYAVVIWNIGYDYGYFDSEHTHHTLSTRDRQGLSSYLDSGGQLWLIGESIAWDLYAGVNSTVPASDFLNAHLGVSRVEHELNTPDPVNGSTGTFMAGASYPTNPDWTDWGNAGDFATNLTPSARGVTILNGSTTDIWGKSFANASVAVAVNNSTYRSVFWGFEFSWISTNANFDDAVNRTMGFFNRSKVLNLSANELAVEVVVDPLVSDWLPVLATNWGRPFDRLANYRQPFNVTIVVRNLGSAAQTNVTVNVTLQDNTTAALQFLQMTFADIPSLSRVWSSTALTPNVHGYLTVNASFNRTDGNASNNADGKSVLVPNWAEEVGSASGWTLGGDWRTTTAAWYTAPRSFRVGTVNNANDSLTSPLINLSLVNASSISGGARLYFVMAGVVAGSDTAYFETRNASNATWVTQESLTLFNSPSSWTYYLQGVALTNIANNTGYFRVRLQTGASSTSYLYLDHFLIWTYHERAEALNPTAVVTNVTRAEGQLLDLRGSHGNPNNAPNFTYFWNFGDNTSASTKNTTHTYANNGTYLVRFTVNDGLGANETGSLSLVVANVAPTVASTSASPNASSEGAAVAFSGSCTDPGALDVITYTWNFGDGSANATGASPSHTFADEGNYTVTLTCADPDGGAASVTRFQLVSNLAPAVGAINRSAAPSDEGQRVNFSAACTDAGTLDVVTYSWSFGDGSPNATGASVNHTFANQGNFTVALSCSDADGGSNSSSVVQTVRNLAPAVGSASGSPNPSDEGQQVAFTGSCTDAGTGDAVSFSWNFGDGTSNATGNATNHTFADEGNYTVTFTCSDADGGSNATSFTQTVLNRAPALGSASGTPNPSNEGQAVNFTSACTDAGTLDTLTFTWNFGDGTINATGASAAHTFTDEGNYTVTLRCTDNDGGTNTTIFVQVVNNVAPVVASATGAPSPSDEGSGVSFNASCTDAGASDALTYMWSFGDGGPGAAGASLLHTYLDNGDFSVTLQCSDGDGGVVQSTFVHSVRNVNPTASIGFSNTTVEGSALNFTSTAADASPLDTFSFLWNFGDGTTAGTRNATHAWRDNGVFTVSLSVTDDDLGSVLVQVFVTVQNAAPVANFSVNGTLAEGASVDFTSAVTDPGLDDTFSYLWEFGDGTVSALPMPAHTFVDDGTFTVNLTVTDDDGAAARVSRNVAIGNLNPAMVFGAAEPSGLEGTNASFSLNASDAGNLDALTYEVSFGDGSANVSGSIVAMLTVRHAFPNEGNYTVSATVRDGDGGSVTSSLLFAVFNAAPTLFANASAYVVDEGSTVNFTARVTDLGALDSATVTWSLPPFGPTSGLTASFAFPQDGTYNITVTAVDDGGAVASLVISIVVTNIAPSLDVLLPDPSALLEATPANFSAVVSDPGVLDTIAVTWDWGDGANATGRSATHAYADDGNYTLVVTATDNGGASTVRSFILRVLNVGPVVEAISTSGKLEEGSVVTFNASIRSVPGESITFVWSFGDGGSSATRNTTHNYTDSGSYTARLTVSDGEGGVDVKTVVLEISNVAPTLACQVCPDAAVEGQPIAVRAHASDPGRHDAITYRLTLPNGTVLTSNDGAFDFSLDAPGAASLTLAALDGDGGISNVTFRVTVLADFDRDGLEDSIDPDDDNDATPDALDPAPHDPAVGRPGVSTPTGGSLGLLLLLAVIAAAVILVAVRLRRRGGGSA